MTQYLERAGLRLAYDDTGARGARPVAVLIHGWISERADLRAVGAALAPTYRVVALDAPGHGESAVPDPDTAAPRLAIPAQAADVAALCDHLGVSGALLVGHSAGGAVAVELAARRPDLAAAVVALDGTMLFRKEVLAGVEPLLAALRTPAWREAMNGFLRQSYLPSDDPALLAAELAAVARMPQHVVAAVPEQFLEWDAEVALRDLRAPLLYVDAGQMTDLDRLAELVPTVAIARAAAVGMCSSSRTRGRPSRRSRTSRRPTAVARSTTARPSSTCSRPCRRAIWTASTTSCRPTSSTTAPRPGWCRRGPRATARSSAC